MSNIPMAMCAHCNVFVGSVFRLTLSQANVEPRLIFVEENIQGEPTTTFVLNVQVVCMCVLSYKSLSIELSIIFLEQVSLYSLI